MCVPPSMAWFGAACRARGGVTPSPPGLPMPAVLDLSTLLDLRQRRPWTEVDRDKVRRAAPAHHDDAFPAILPGPRRARLSLYPRRGEQSRTCEVEAAFDDSASTDVPPGASADIESFSGARGCPRVPTYAVVEGRRVLVLQTSDRAAPLLGSRASVAETGVPREPGGGGGAQELGVRGGYEGDLAGTTVRVSPTRRGEGRGPAEGCRDGKMISLSGVTKPTSRRASCVRSQELDPRCPMATISPSWDRSGVGEVNLLNSLLPRPAQLGVLSPRRTRSSETQRSERRSYGAQIGFVFQVFHSSRHDRPRERRAPMLFAEFRRASARKKPRLLWFRRALDRADHRPTSFRGERQRVAIARSTVMGPPSCSP